jgi:anaerobic ribonucleoside-triphosphate reductase activating protein
MNYGNIKYNAIEDGIGCRTVLFVSGCRHHCKGCFQPLTWDFNYGEPFTKETEDMILDSMDHSYTHGLTLLGGEPFEPENQKVILPFLRRVKTRYPDKSIWAYSGYTWEEMHDDTSLCRTENTDEILSMIDILVDGEFKENLKNIMLPFRGSENQRVIDVQQSLKTNTIVLSKYGERTR